MRNKTLSILILIVLTFTFSSCKIIELTNNDNQQTQVQEDANEQASNEELLKEENFRNSESGWDRYYLQTGSADYVDNGYEIKIDQPQQYLWGNMAIESPVNVRVKVITNKLSGDADDFYGVICRYQNEGNFYALVISGDGYAGIFKRENWSDLQSLTGKPMLPIENFNKEADSHQLKVDCVGDHLALHVDNELSTVVKDITFSPATTSPGDVGLIAGTFSANKTHIRFTDFQLYEAK